MKHAHALYMQHVPAVNTEVEAAMGAEPGAEEQHDSILRHWISQELDFPSSESSQLQNSLHANLPK